MMLVVGALSSEEESQAQQDRASVWDQLGRQAPQDQLGQQDQLDRQGQLVQFSAFNRVLLRLLRTPPGKP